MPRKPRITVCRSCKKFKRSTLSGMCMDCQATHLQHQTKLCNTCHETRAWDQFYAKPGGLYDLGTKCKVCVSHYAHKRLLKKEQFLKQMLLCCKANNDARNKNGVRKLAFTWTYQQMVTKLEEQDDCCAYSDLPMNFRSHSNWKCSPERIDDNKGYVDENMKFICSEFQLSLQGSRELVNTLCRLETNPHPRLEEIVTEKFIEKQHIPHCHLGQHECKECQSSYNSYYRNTIGGRLRILSWSAYSSTVVRNNRGRNHGASENDYDDNLKMLQDQQGKCKLTGHHLSFQTGTWNCASLERIDVSLPYNKTGNCCLILRCLNTADRSSQKSLANPMKEGCAGWTREKIEYLRRFREEKR